MISPDLVKRTHERIAPYLNRTPLLRSSLLDRWLGHEIIFKAEGFQRTGSFKARGALNTLLAAKEEGRLPAEVVAFSSGNHAQAVAWAGRLLGTAVTIFFPPRSSTVKMQATRGYGATVISASTRAEAERQAADMAAGGAYLVHPYDNETVITGQGTACLEALEDGAAPTAIFAPCGGGGLLSGTFLAASLLAPDVPVFGGEPLEANDAVRSYRSGEIVRLPDAGNTIADGARTLAVSPRTFEHLRHLRDFYEVSEDQIIYWTQWLTTLLKAAVEPTSAVAMGAAHRWLCAQTTPQRVLVILSGGNIDPATYRQIWNSNLLEAIPACQQRSTAD